MRRVISSSSVGPAVKYFFTLSHKKHILFKLWNIKRVLHFSLRCVCVCETLLILRRVERDMIKICIGLHVKYPLFLSEFNKVPKYQIS